MPNVMDDENCGVYCILNVESGKKYVGSSLHIRKRWSQHIVDLKAGRHSNARLQNSWNKHGADAFVFYIIETCASDVRLERETSFIQQWKTYAREYGYNLAPSSTTSSVKMSDEARQRLSEQRKGKPLHQNTIDGHSAYVSNPANTKARSMKRVANMRSRGSYSFMTPEFFERLAASKRGVPLSEQNCRNLWLANRTVSDDDIRNVVRLRVNGHTLKSIAALMGKSFDVPQRILKARRHYSFVNDLMREECDYKLEMALKRARDESSSTSLTQ